MSEQSIEQQILVLNKTNHSIREIARLLNINKYTVEKTLKNRHLFTLRQVSEVVSQLSEIKLETVSENSEITNQTVSDNSKTVKNSNETGYENFNSNEFNTSIQTQTINESAIQLMRMYSINNFQQIYKDFLYRFKEFISNSLGSKESAPTYIKNRQESIERFIRTAKDFCLGHHIVYKDLFMAFTLDQLYLYLEKEPEFVTIEYDTKLKVDAKINLLLKKSLNSDIFDLKVDYENYFQN